MASPGFAGKILKVDLTTKKIEALDSAKYEQFGGGYGTAIALFWDLCVAPGGWDLQDAFDPRNIVSIMSGPLAGCGIPFAGRTSVSGLSPQGWPINWFTKSNFGGDFGPALKFAGWDGVIVQGKSDKPVYINVIDDKVTIEDASKIWGLDTWETQMEIVKLQTGKRNFDGDVDWRAVGNQYTLRKPAIVTTSQAGEKLSRIASLQHGGGAAAGLGGFGGVFGSKKLKAIAVIGTGSFKVADPKILMETRDWLTQPAGGFGGGGFGGAQQAKSSCVGCTRACRTRAKMNEAGRDSDGCMETTWYTVHPPSPKTAPADATKATDLPQKYGLNSFDTCFGGVMWFDAPTEWLKPATPEAPGAGWYIKRLYDAGHIGPGTKVDTAPLPMDKYNTYEFGEIFAKTIANREGIGNLLAEGVVRFAEKIGRIDDLNTILRCPSWGYTDHWAMPEVSWAYGDLIDSRDICNHDLQMPLMSVGGGMGGGRGARGGGGGQDAAAWVQGVVKAMVPYDNDPFMLDHSWKDEQAYKTGIYSEHKAKLVAWRLHYQTFYKESCLFCDWGYASYQNRNGKGTPDAEPRIYNAITGKKMTFAEGIEIGRKAWTLQGRNKKNEKFAGYMYRPGASASGFTKTLPIYDGSSWKFTDCADLYFDDKGVEAWKTHYYKLEGWDPETGYPTQATLDSLGMKNVADILKKNKKLGSA
jgi:aldehyde:ferredoxin oxidoreductase